MPLMKALALVESPDHVCCRYRLRAFEPAWVRAGGVLDYAGMSGNSWWSRLETLLRCRRYDIIIVQRRLPPVWQTALLRARSRRLIFDLDDAVMYRDSNHRRGPHSPRRARRFAAIASRADLVIAGNAFLAEQSCAAGARPDAVTVIPTCVPIPDLDAVRKSAEQSFPPPRLRDPLAPWTLVWIGSSSTLSLLEQQHALWSQLPKVIPFARLRIICDRFPNFDPLPVSCVPWSEAVETPALVNSDAGVSWIPDDLWSRGKCGLKVLQYQAAGLPTVANPVGVHPEMIQPGVNGFLARTPEEWSAILRDLAHNPDLCQQLGNAARDLVIRNYGVDAWSDRFVAALAGSDASKKTPLT